MNLRDQATVDLGLTLGNPAHFGQPFTLTSPGGFTGGTLYGAAGDIGMLIDPDTGTQITGRHASLSVAIAALEAVGFANLPEGVPGGGGKPWIATIGALAFKVKMAFPDRTLGIVTMVLEFYTP